MLGDGAKTCRTRRCSGRGEGFLGGRARDQLKIEITTRISVRFLRSPGTSATVGTFHPVSSTKAELVVVFF